MKFNGFKNKFTSKDQSYYSEGSCHEFAIAMNRLFGYEYMLITSDDVSGGTDEEGEIIPCVVHVFSYDPEKDVIHDVFGSSPSKEYEKHIEENFNYLCVDITGNEIISTEEELNYYINHNDLDDRPLSFYTRKDIDEASSLILSNSHIV